MPKLIFMRCELCGKKLIERMPNGLWRFVFGKNPESPDLPPVEIQIHGSLKMRCLRRSCRTENPNFWNILNFFPTSFNRSNLDRSQNKIRRTETTGNNFNKIERR